MKAWAKFGVLGALGGVLGLVVLASGRQSESEDVARIRAMAAEQAVAQRAMAEASMAEDARRSAERARTLVTVDFKGGTLAEYVAAVRAAQPAANVTYTTDAASFPVGVINLKDAAVIEAIDVLGKLRAADDAQALAVELAGEVLAVRLTGSPGGDARIRTNVESVQFLLSSGLKAEDILSAIDAVADVGQGGASIKFHPETGLLIMRGSHADVHAISEALVSLRSTATTKQSFRAIEDFAQLQQRVQALEVRLAAMEKAKTAAPQ